jgi:glycosyltransferase involved in cell wall biosynthesis
MTVVLIAHYLGPCLGIGQYLDRLLPPLVTELSHQGIEVRIFASPNAIAKTPALQKLEHLVNILPPLDDSPIKRYLWIARNFSNYCQKQQIKAVVWLSNPLILPWHPPSIAVIHDVNEWKAMTKGFLRTKFRALVYLDNSIKFARQIIVVSQTTEDDLLTFRPHSNLKPKLKAITNGCDSQLVDLPTAPINVSNNPFFLYVGRIDPFAKRLPDAIALVENFREITNQDWEFHLIGGINVSTQKAAEQFLFDIENIPWVHYHGYVEDQELAEWYRRTIAVICISDHEGFGLPISEGVSFNRWVVVSQKNKAAIEAGGNGLISINPDQPQEASKKIWESLKIAQIPPHQTSLSTWKNTANLYAQEIRTFMRNI